MVRIPLQKITQKNITFFLMVADPRLIVKVSKYGDANSLQEYQRPWIPKRVKEVSEFVAGESNLSEKEYDLVDSEPKKAMGLIPNCPLLNLRERLIVEEGDKFYLDLPEKGECFDILDGQHRLIAFSEEYIRIGNSEIYEMGFVICDNLTGNVKKEMFLVPNTKQEKVDRNVLLAMYQELGLFNKKNANYYMIIDALSEDEASPMYGKVKLGGKKVAGGISPTTLMSILRKSRFTDRLGSKEWRVQFNNLVEYLRAWDIVYHEKSSTKSHTLNKGLGVRYMFIMGLFVFTICDKNRIDWTTKNIAEILRKLRVGITDDEGTFNTSRENTVNPFSGESSTDALAEAHGQKLEEICGGDRYDIFGKRY